MRAAQPGHLRAARLRRLIRQQQKATMYVSPKLYDREEIKSLLLSGLSLTAVSKIVGCSIWPIQVVKKELERNGFVYNRGKHGTNSKTIAPE